MVFLSASGSIDLAGRGDGSPCAARAGGIPGGTACNHTRAAVNGVRGDTPVIDAKLLDLRQRFGAEKAVDASKVRSDIGTCGSKIGRLVVYDHRRAVAVELHERLRVAAIVAVVLGCEDLRVARLEAARAQAAGPDQLAAGPG